VINAQCSLTCPAYCLHWTRSQNCSGNDDVDDYHGSNNDYAFQYTANSWTQIQAKYSIRSRAVYIFYQRQLVTWHVWLDYSRERERDWEFYMFAKAEAMDMLRVTIWPTAHVSSMESSLLVKKPLKMPENSPQRHVAVEQHDMEQ